jgi:hypothetical protein
MEAEAIMHRCGTYSTSKTTMSIAGDAPPFLIVYGLLMRGLELHALLS